MECSRSSYFFSWGRGSLWQIIIYAFCLIGRGLLFSYLRLLKEGYLLTARALENGDRQSKLDVRESS